MHGMLEGNPIGTTRLRQAMLMPHRYYNPNIGRFTSFDSFEGNKSDPMHLHKYNYGAGDPINHVDPSGRDWTSTNVLVTSGIIAGLTAFGAFVGYKITGTVRGAMWGALGGAANGAIIALYKGKGLIRANIMGLVAGGIAMVDAWQSRHDGNGDETESEAFVRGYSSAVAAAAATVVVADKLGPVMSRFLGDPDVANSVMAGSIVELGTAAVNGNLWEHPWRTFSNIIIHAGVSYATKRFGVASAPYVREKEVREMMERTMAIVAGWAAARVNDLVQDTYKYFGPNAV